MKKTLVLIPLIMLSCKKEASITETSTQDSAQTVTQKIEQKSVETTAKKDSIINNAPATKEVLRNGVMRDETKNQISRTADASMLPFSLGEEIANDQQEFVLKIKDYDKPNIVAEIKPQNESQNIRFNQVKFADGTTDGPFGRTLNIPNKSKGEIWLIIGKSNMASGDPKGNFTVSIQ